MTDICHALVTCCPCPSIDATRLTCMLRVSQVRGYYGMLVVGKRTLRTCVIDAHVAITAISKDGARSAKWSAPCNQSLEIR
jgi:hypothetical protein